jgi:hypothetical protein
MKPVHIVEQQAAQWPSDHATSPVHDATVRCFRQQGMQCPRNLFTCLHLLRIVYLAERFTSWWSGIWIAYGVGKQNIAQGETFISSSHRCLDDGLRAIPCSARPG